MFYGSLTGMTEKRGVTRSHLSKKATKTVLSHEASQPPAEGDFGSIRRVLVVDDSRLQRRILSKSLQKWGFQVVEAAAGDEALEVCRTLAPDLVLSDWMMPGMNGLEFCREFRKLPADFYGYFILLTSKSDKMEVAQGLDAGADDFLSKPVSPSELRARISAGDRILAMQRELSEKNRMIGDTLEQLQTAYDSIDRDLMQAKKIQKSLIPETSRDFDGASVSLLIKPCGHIGGDLVGMFSPSPTKIGFYNIDVSGHGITSAMMTARLAGYLSSTHFNENLGLEWQPDGSHVMRSPCEVARLLNERQVADTGIDEYFTLAYATIDLETGALQLVQAGHPHPVILRADGGVEFLGEGGVPIGLLPDVPYSQVETQLQKGDRLLLYSDGFTECVLSDGTMLEQEGLLELIAKCQPGQTGREFLDDLFWNLTQIMDVEQGLDDDVSATLLEYRGTS